MVKLATSILAIALVAAPTLAVSSERYYERNTDDVLITRQDLENLFGREFVNEIEEREPFGLGFLVKGIRGAVKLGEKAHKAHEHAHEAHEHLQNQNNNNHHKREFVEDLEEREPFGLGFLVKGIRGAVKLGEKAHKAHEHAHEAHEHLQNNQNQNNHHKRELEEFYPREPLHYGHVFKAAEHLASHAAGEYFGRRALEEIDAREPIIRFGHAVHGPVHLASHTNNAASEDNNNEGRELGIDEELLARYFYDDLD